MDSHIPFIKPELPPVEEVSEDLRTIYKNNYYSNNGPVYLRFIEAMEKYLGQELHAVGLNNATTALMLAIKACFTSGKKYVALPAFTFPAGPLAIEWCGFRPVFFDIEEEAAQPSLMSFEKLHAQYGKDLAGVLLINNFGIGNEQIDKWEQVCKEHDLPLVIDSAPGIGSEYPDGTLLGGRGDCEIFSMHVTKPFGIGEGGLLTTRSESLAQKIESFKNFGFGQGKLTDKEGLNGKITELDCAIGLRILERYESVLTRRRAVHAAYEELLSSDSRRFLPHARKAAIQFATVVVEPELRDKILLNLADHAIDARTYYAPPLHRHPYFEKAPRVDLSATEKLSSQVISLPVHNDMTPEVIERICSHILSVS